MTGKEHLPRPLRSAEERSLLLEHNDLITFVEEALNIIMKQTNSGTTAGHRREPREFVALEL